MGQLLTTVSLYVDPVRSTSVAPLSTRWPALYAIGYCGGAGRETENTGKGQESLSTPLPPQTKGDGGPGSLAGLLFYPPCPFPK